MKRSLRLTLGLLVLIQTSMASASSESRVQRLNSEDLKKLLPAIKLSNEVSSQLDEEQQLQIEVAEVRREIENLEKEITKTRVKKYGSLAIAVSAGLYSIYTAGWTLMYGGLAMAPNGMKIAGPRIKSNFLKTVIFGTVAAKATHFVILTDEELDSFLVELSVLDERLAVAESTLQVIGN